LWFRDSVKIDSRREIAINEAKLELSGYRLSISDHFEFDRRSLPVLVAALESEVPAL